MPTIKVIVRDEDSQGVVVNAPVIMDGFNIGKTRSDGSLSFQTNTSPTRFETTAMGVTKTKTLPQPITSDDTVVLEPSLGGSFGYNYKTALGGARWPALTSTYTPPTPLTPIEVVSAGTLLELNADANKVVGTKRYSWKSNMGAIVEPADKQSQKVHWDTNGAEGLIPVQVEIIHDTGSPETTQSLIIAKEIYIQRGAGESVPRRLFRSSLRSPDAAAEETRRGEEIPPIPVTLKRTIPDPTADQVLWPVIRTRARAISFSDGYEDFITKVLCEKTELHGENVDALNRQGDELYTPVHGVGAYELLRTATQVFLLMNCGFRYRRRGDHVILPDDLIVDATEEGVRIGRELDLNDLAAGLSNYLGLSNGLNPYIQRVLSTGYRGFDPHGSIFCEGLIATRVTCPPLIELIWSYWMEEGMLVQSMNAISRRFRNRSGGPAGRDPLANMEVGSLYPLNNLLWGYVQDEHHRLSIDQRNYEYLHQYGLTLRGKAVSDAQAADIRSKFLEAFHNLLYLTTVFYKQSDDTTIVPDEFPVYNALREVHQILAYGAHNQFGDLPWTARVEMLMQQWILARPEMRRFLLSRDMVPYREPWMPQVDAMKSIQGWTDVSITHFQELAAFGEQIVLSIRYGDWMDDPQTGQAANWARYWRPEIQRYIHAYRAVTGVDLAAATASAQQRELLSVQPSLLILRRQNTPAGLPAPTPAALPANNGANNFRDRRTARQV